METYRTETDSMGEIQVPAARLWGAQTQRSLHYFSIGRERMPPELISTYAVLKQAAALANRDLGHLDPTLAAMIATACDEILAGRHDTEFPLHVWMTGSGTQFNMNINEVIANRSCQLAGTPLGSKRPVHPNDHVNMSQSSNDTFPAAMHIAALVAIRQRLVPAVSALRDALGAKAIAWQDIVKIGRTHLQDATPLTLGQEFSGYAAMLSAGLRRLVPVEEELRFLALGGTAVGTGINAPPGFASAATAHIAALTNLPFETAPNFFAAMGAHDALVALSSALRGLAVSLFKIASDIRLLASGPRAGLGELLLPENEPGSSIMPGKVNPTQTEAMTMLAAQVMANDVAVGLGGAGGQLEMNVYKPLILHNTMQSISLLTDGCTNFRRFLVEGMEPNHARIAEHVERSLMLVTALAPVIGYDRAAEVAHRAMAQGSTLREAAAGVVSAEEFDRIVDPGKMVGRKDVLF
jgi:fumarate hydratase class II